MAAAPTGRVTFLFTDIEGSTQRWERHADSMRSDLAQHDRILREVIEARGGFVFKTIGDAFCATFQHADAALASVVDAQRRLRAATWGPPGPVKVRMALHTGIADELAGDYLGPAVNRVARLLAAGHGAQVLVSQATELEVAERLQAGVTLRDLGLRRLKDLVRPEHVFQVLAADLPAEFPPLHTLDLRPNNLPEQPTPFLGRKDLLDQAVLLLRRSEVRLLTLTGAGGTGKTRLALQAAATIIDEHRDGVWFVSLATLPEPGFLARTIAGVLGLQEPAGGTLAEALAERLRPAELLLVLDNFESVIDEAPLVGRLLAAAPRLKVLATSRALLRVHAEHDLGVPPLGYPEETGAALRDIAEYDAIRLFVERARALRPAFKLDAGNVAAVAGICRLLDGLPLALELAAARIRLFSPQGILERMTAGGGRSALHFLTGGPRDAPARQQALRDTIASSHDLLKPEEQRLFRIAGSFIGGFALEEAEQVARDGSGAVLDVVQSLLDQSLLRREEHAGATRFRMLETLREFALERQAQAGETDTLRDRHADAYARLAADAHAALSSSVDSACLDRLDVEHDNLRAALSWSIARGQGDRALELAVHLWRFWDARGYWFEGRKFIDAALALRGEDLSATRGSALNAAGVFSFRLGDLSRSLTLHESALQLFRAIGDVPGIVDSLDRLQWVVMYQGDGARGAAYCEEAMRLVEPLRDRRRLARALGQSGWIAFERGDFDAALAKYEECVAIYRSLPDRADLASALNALGEVLRGRQEFERAATAYREALDLARQSGIRRQVMVTVMNLGAIALQLGHLPEAAALHIESLRLMLKAGNRYNIVVSLASIAELASLAGRPESGAELLGATDALSEEMGLAVTFLDRDDYDRAIATTRRLLDPAAYQARYLAGRGVGYDRAVEQAFAIAESIEGAKGTAG